MNLKWSSLAKTRRLKQTLVAYWPSCMIHVSNLSNWCKVDVPNSNTTIINGYLILNGIYVVRCESKNENQNDICSQEIELHPYNMLNFLSSIVNMIGVDLLDHLTSTRIFTLILMRMISKYHEANDYVHDLESLIILQ